MSALLVAISLVTVIAAGAVAQSEPTPEQAIVPAGFNADKVDGRHAVGHRASRKKRAGKLVATNKQGFLPSNIIRPAWKLILGKPAAFRDGRITWGEVQNKPGGFADGVDDAGVTSVKVTQVWGLIVAVAAGAGKSAEVHCPGGSRAVGGGLGTTSTAFALYASFAIDASTGWRIFAKNNGGTPGSIQAVAQCLSADPATTISTASKGKKRK
jgi:hypothetical protein